MAESPSEAVPTLSGERVLLRPVTTADIEQLDRIVREPSVAKWWPIPAGKGVGYDVLDPDETAFAIECGGQLAGTIMFAEETEALYRHASVDIMLATAFQGCGLGSEALRVLIRYLIGERGHHRITIDPAVANEHAIRAYEAVGFKRVGVMREYEGAADGTWHDNLLMDLLAREFVDEPSPRTGR